MSAPDILAIERTTTDRAVVTFTLSAADPAFAGHFPSQPILPGVVQVDWAMQLAARCLGIAQRVACDFQVKFRRVLRPGDAVSLYLQLDRAKRRLSFEYRLAGEIASNGRVSLETPP